MVVGGEGGAGYAEFADAGGGGVEEGGAGGGGEGSEVAVIGVEVGGELEACLGGVSLRVWWTEVAGGLPLW